MVRQDFDLPVLLAAAILLSLVAFTAYISL